MNTFDIILQQVGLFVIYILAGLLLVKTKVLNRETLEPISKFVIKMALPLMVFINITDGTDKKNLYESWPILVIAVGFYICIYAAGAMAVKFFKLQESRVGIYRAMLLFGNIGFIGLPMISNVFPENFSYAFFRRMIACAYFTFSHSLSSCGRSSIYKNLHFPVLSTIS